VITLSEKTTLKIADYRDGSGASSPCPRCGALISSSATLCEHCGVHFRGYAGEFAPDSSTYRPRGRVYKAMAAALLVLMALVMLTLAAVLMFQGTA
jgi:predicted amidophosphoribosyltransferase